jgi:thioredoxin-related protein
VSIDISNQKKGTLKVVSETGVTFPLLLDNKSVGRKLYKVRGTPTTFIINGEGQTVFKHVGYNKGMEEVFSKEIESLLGGPA